MTPAASPARDAAHRRARAPVRRSKLPALTDVNIATRLWLGFGVAIVLTLATCAAGNWALSLAQTAAGPDGSALAEQLGRGRMVLDGLAVLAVLASATLAYVISRSIVGPLRQAIAVSTWVSKGDLTSTSIAIVGHDEVSELLWRMKDMNENLGVLVGQVRGGADTMAAAAAGIAGGSRKLSSRTEQQATSLEQTASAMEQLTTTVRQNADHARQANGLAAAASDVASQGGAVVGEVVETMASINASSMKITDIVGVIDSIAFQTNILALNAAVEAARAGEQGRGFAVVASEVRNLAQRSASAAKEIKELIDSSVAQVASGGRLVGQAGTTMTGIVASIREVSEVVGGITSASHEQSDGIGRISDSIQALDEMTQQNAVLVEQSLAAAQGLEQQALALVDIVKVFKLERAPRGAAQARAAAPAAALR